MKYLPPQLGGRKLNLPQGGEYYNRTSFRCCDVDLNEESPLGPMRLTDKVYKNKAEYEQDLCRGLNIFSVKITSSDVAFPLHVYGTVVARDSIDYKCIYLFRRDKDHSQLIDSETQSLILTGPKRGLALLDDDYVEIDLKIKDHQGQEKELSKGFLTIRGIAGRSWDECTIENMSLATRLSTVDVMYAVVRSAVEATIAIEDLRGDFYGEITACTTSMKNCLVLHDSKLDGVLTDDDKGVVQLMRPVISVNLEDMLDIVVKTGDGKFECTIKLAPKVNGREGHEIIVGATKMHLKASWSIMDC